MSRTDMRQIIQEIQKSELDTEEGAVSLKKLYKRLAEYEIMYEGKAARAEDIRTEITEEITDIIRILSDTVTRMYSVKRAICQKAD